MAAAGAALVVAGVGSLGGAAPASADSGVLTKLLGEGGSFAEPIIDQIQTDGASVVSPLVPQYFDANIDQGRDDFADGTADYAVSELPLTGAEAGTAASIGRSFAYVPFAASPLAIAAVVECSNDTVLKPTTMCPNLQLTMTQLAEIFSQQITTWGSASLAGISAGNPDAIVPTSNSNLIYTKNLVDPAASNYELEQAFVDDPQGKVAWDAYLNSLKITDDTPSVTWPTSGGISGGDEALANSLVPLNPDAEVPAPEPNPSEWGQGQVAGLPIDWVGAPRDIPTIAIQNAAGAFVSPTVAGASAALADATTDPTTNLVTFNASTTDTAAYPLTMMSYLVVPTTGLSAGKATALSNFIQFVLSAKGQADVQSFGAAPVTPAMVTEGLAVAKTVAAETGTSTTTTTTTAAPVSSADNGSSGVVTSSNGTDASDQSSGPTLANTGLDPLPLLAVGGFLITISLMGRLWARRRHAVVVAGRGTMTHAEEGSP